jgi:hypothetical protein
VEANVNSAFLFFQQDKATPLCFALCSVPESLAIQVKLLRWFPVPVQNGIVVFVRDE